MRHLSRSLEHVVNNDHDTDDRQDDAISDLTVVMITRTITTMTTRRCPIPVTMRNDDCKTEQKPHDSSSDYNFQAAAPSSASSACAPIDVSAALFSGDYDAGSKDFSVGFSRVRDALMKWNRV